jgi:hypothetical protein
MKLTGTNDTSKVKPSLETLYYASHASGHPVGCACSFCEGLSNLASSSFGSFAFATATTATNNGYDSHPASAKASRIEALAVRHRLLGFRL